MEAKGRDKREVEFFGKFILCSNNEESFIKIDESEIRFWVLKISKIQHEDTELLAKMKREISAFLYFLSNRKLSVEKPLSRMWFHPEQIRTKALTRLIQYNRCRTERELASLLMSVMEKFDWDEIKVCPNDLLYPLNRSRVKTDLTEIRKLLNTNWRLEAQKNSYSYEKFSIDVYGDYISSNTKGRYYTIKKDFLQQNFDDLMTE